MTVRAMQAGLRIAEVPSLELPRRAGKSNLHAVRDGWRVLTTVVRGRRRGGHGHAPAPLARRMSSAPRALGSRRGPVATSMRGR